MTTPFAREALDVIGLFWDKPLRQEVSVLAANPLTTAACPAILKSIMYD
ncbi:MAG: hypothetical protein V1792_14110 [Pseudomonadota bacterium]